jgi:hypothetical protein
VFLGRLKQDLWGIILPKTDFGRANKPKKRFFKKLKTGKQVKIHFGENS